MFQRVRHLVSKRRITGLLTIFFTLPILLAAAPAYAASDITISNLPTSATNLNAQSIADNLVFTSIQVQAANSITISDTVDLSSSSFGIPHFNLSLIAPVCNINNNMNLSTQG